MLSCNVISLCLAVLAAVAWAAGFPGVSRKVLCCHAHAHLHAPLQPACPSAHILITS